MNLKCDACKIVIAVNSNYVYCPCCGKSLEQPIRVLCNEEKKAKQWKSMWSDIVWVGVMGIIIGGEISNRYLHLTWVTLPIGLVVLIIGLIRVGKKYKQKFPSLQNQPQLNDEE